MPPKTYRCSRCKQAKPASDFVSTFKHCSRCREYLRRYAVEHRERLNLARRSRYRANPEPAKQRTREWARRNRERNVARASAWNKANRGRANKSMNRAWHKRQRVPYTDAGWAYREILLTDPCSYCGGPAGEVDHIDPIANGGDGDWPNLTAACRSCNAQKHARSLLAYLAD